MMLNLVLNLSRLKCPRRLLSSLLLSGFLSGMLPLALTLPGHDAWPALTAAAQAGASGFAPQTYKSGLIYGTGIYFAPYRFTIYREPDSQAEPIGTFRWGRENGADHVDVSLPDGEWHHVDASDPFLCFYPGIDIAMMAVVGENGKGWAEVVYDQSGRKTGWVQLAPDHTETSSERSAEVPAHFGVYQTWLEFMRLNAKTGGVYWLSGVKEYNRSVRMSDADDAKLIPVTIIRDLKVKHVRGNWLLVEVLDFERNRPLGWVRWRDDEGNLMVFPNLSGRKLPIVTTAY